MFLIVCLRYLSFYEINNKPEIETGLRLRQICSLNLRCWTVQVMAVVQWLALSEANETTSMYSGMVLWATRYDTNKRMLTYNVSYNQLQNNIFITKLIFFEVKYIFQSCDLLKWNLKNKAACIFQIKPNSRPNISYLLRRWIR